VGKDSSRKLEMAARYEPHDVEKKLMKRWLDRKAFYADPEDARPAYTISIPPPNVTGSLHMGHALNDTIQDVLIRHHELKGFNTLWVVGTDHAGIATQNKVEGQLATEGLRKEDIGREAFEQRVWEWRRQYGSTIIHQLKSLGCACDYDSERFTMDEAYQQAVIKRHMTGGRSYEDAARHYAEVDGRNSDLVLQTRHKADKVIPPYYRVE